MTITTTSINLPHIVTTQTALEETQHLTTDVNDALNRIQQAIKSLAATAAALDARLTLAGW